MRGLSLTRCQLITLVLLGTLVTVGAASSPLERIDLKARNNHWTRGPDPSPHGDTHAGHDDQDDSDDEMDMDMTMDMGMMTGATTTETSITSLTNAAATFTSAITASSSIPLSNPQGSDPHLSHDHHHSSHTPAKTILDDVDIHNWHQFPPTYLAADFRLTNDSAIFGEDFGEDWDPAKANGHPGLMVLHVGAMMVAYFGALPVGESAFDFLNRVMTHPLIPT